ncbi:MAG: radical SAM protein [Deltaproteobacteria bacterium]|nr:radical SAM protein [Deltaproteobacteria bacterium]
MVFGPVPSRRFGRSLGINNIPPKSCSYSCVYCQVGRTPETTTVPRTFRPPQEIISAVTRRVEVLRTRGEQVDFLTFVSDGEPSLDHHLGAEIDGLRPLGVPIAVISNGSLAWRDDVRAALCKADRVSFKVDSVDETSWRRVDRPDPSLQIDVILDGMLRFSSSFEGELITETMLIRGLNDASDAIDLTAAFMASLGPRVAYLAVPTRPPAEPWIRSASEDQVNRAFQRFAERLPRVELLTHFEGTAFGTTGDPIEDLLGITAVHPIREDALLSLLARDGADRSILDRLISEDRLRPVRYQGHTFYVRRLSRVRAEEGGGS